MSGKCMWHSGVMTELRNAQKDAAEARTDMKQVLKAIHKKASTATLISMCAILVTATGIVTKLAYDSYQKRMERLEAAEISIQVEKRVERARIDEQILAITNKLDGSLKNIHTRLDSIQSVVKRIEQTKKKECETDEPRSD
jgi:methyl coenzyme M reductase subunit C-like uncharacterized protein (methanogenesis marker protein 7)